MTLQVPISAPAGRAATYANAVWVAWETALADPRRLWASDLGRKDIAAHGIIAFVTRVVRRQTRGALGDRG